MFKDWVYTIVYTIRIQQNKYDFTIKKLKYSVVFL